MEKTGYSEWGVHATVDCGGCNISAISDKNTIAAFTEYLVRKIDMVAYGDPIIEHFATHDPSKGGYTLLQMIETSAITAHFVEATGEAYFDIFSCKEFDVDTVVACIQGFFSPTRVQYSLLSRGVNYDLPEGARYTGDDTVDSDGLYTVDDYSTETQIFYQSRQKAQYALALYEKIDRLRDSYHELGFDSVSPTTVPSVNFWKNDGSTVDYNFTNNNVGKEFSKHLYSLVKIDILSRIEEINDKLEDLGFEPVLIGEIMIQDATK